MTVRIYDLAKELHVDSADIIGFLGGDKKPASGLDEDTAEKVREKFKPVVKEEKKVSKEISENPEKKPAAEPQKAEVKKKAKMEAEAQQAWNEILDRMIFLLREADDKTCSKKNPYEAEFDRAAEEFTRKYGVMGERLEIGEKRGGTASSPGSRVYTLLDVEAYRPIAKRYMEEERKRLYSKVSGNPIIMV